MRTLVSIILSVFYSLCVRGAVPTFESFSDQFQTNNLRLFLRATHTNDFGIIYPALDNTLTLVTNQNTYGTFSLPAKVTLLTLGTNYLDLSTNSTWLLNSPTNDATQVILSLSAGAYQGQLAFITSQNGNNSFTLPDLSEQWDVPGAYVDIQGDWIGTTNRGIILQYTAPDWIEMARFDPSGGTFWNPDEANAANPSWSIGGTFSNPGAGIYRAPNGALAIASTAVNIATFNTDSVRFNDATPLLWSTGAPDTTVVQYGFYHGSGSPEGVQTANVGSLYTDWSTGDYYHKTSGTGNTGWVIFSSGGGSALWASAGGVLEPSPAVDVVSIVSQLADNSTNVALVVDTLNTWYSPGALLASFRDNETNQLAISTRGGIGVGYYTTDSNSIDDGTTLSSWRLASEEGFNFLILGVWDSAPNNSSVDMFLTLNEVDLGGFVEAGSVNNGYNNVARSGEVYYEIIVNGNPQVTLLRPSAGATETGYHFGSVYTHTSGNLFDIDNNGTNKFTVDWRGDIAAARTVYSGFNTSNLFNTADYSFASLHDTTLGDDTFNTLHIESRNTANTHGSYVDAYAKDDATNPENSIYTASSAGGTSSAFTLRAGHQSGRSLFDMDVRSISVIDFHPDSAATATAFSLSTAASHTSGTLFQVQNNLTNQFVVAALSGYTGGGTLFLSDDGTYKAASGGGGAPVGTMVESGITTAGVVPMTSGTDGTNYVASAMRSSGTNVAFNGNITANTITATNTVTATGAITTGNQFVTTIAAGNVGLKIQNGTGSSISWNGVGIIKFTADGKMLVSNDGGTGFTWLQLGPDAATPSSVVQVKGPGGLGTDKNGGDLSINGGTGTGTGRGGALLGKTSLTTTTGSTAQTESTRYYHSAKFVDLTESTATLIGNVALAASKYLGVRLNCTVTANDGTDFQAVNSNVSFAAVDKAGTVTVGAVTQNDDATAASSGTLTVTYTAVANGAGVDIKANAVSSLSQTVLRAKWSIISLNTDDLGTVTPN